MSASFVFDEHTAQVMDYIRRTISYNVPERVAFKRAERKFGVDRKLLVALVRLAEQSGSY